ncbi:MAG: two-component regulator propeller domain-containing protein [Bacteroidota bacterium]
MKHYIGWLFIISIFAVNEARSQSFSSSIRFRNINTSQGLPSNNVNQVIKDDLGFMWVATSDGLARFDSPEQLKTYRAQGTSTDGLSSSAIKTMIKDNEGNLWIGTTLGGVSRLNPKTEAIITYLHDPDDPSSLSNNEILSIMQDRKGRIWVGTEYGLNLYHPEQDRFISYTPSDEEYGLKAKAILSITEDDRGWIWVGTWGGGLYLILENSERYPAQLKFKNFVPDISERSHNIWKIYQDHQGRYWIGTYGNGLYLMQLPTHASNAPRHQDWQPSFRGFQISGVNPSNISSNNITDIYQDRNDDIWITCSYGLNILKSEKLPALDSAIKNGTKPQIAFQKYFYSPGNSESLASNSLNSIYEDENGIIWISTFGGISIYNWYLHQFSVLDITKKTGLETELLDISICGDQVWLATQENGVLCYHIQEEKLIHQNFIQKHFKQNKTYFQLAKFATGKFMIASMDGLSFLDIATKTVKNYPFAFSAQKNGHPDKIITFSIIKDAKGRIWVGTEAGVLLLDEKTGEYQQFAKEENNPQSLSDNSVNQVYEDIQGTIWVATFNGLNRIVENEGNITFEVFKHDANNPTHSIISNRIKMLRDVGGILYVGTTQGLCGYAYDEHIFYDYSENASKFYIESLDLGADGKLWASTTDGIFQFDPETKKVNSYEKIDGIGDFTFRQNSIHQDKKGYIYFGSRRGVTRVHPNHIKKNTVPPVTHITCIKVMGTDSTKTISTLNTKNLSLRHCDYHLSINFVGLNYNRPTKNQFAYKLEGFEENWHLTDSRKLNAVYTNLKADDYIFKVKSANNDGVWSEEVTLDIKVLPAFWETWWFQGMLLLSLVGLIFFGTSYYTKTIRERNLTLRGYNTELNNEIAERKRVEAELQKREQHMEQLVIERTAELEDKKDEVEVLLQKIKIRNEELEIIVEKRTNKLKEYNQELQRSNKDLEQFAYMASHDLQEPLRNVGTFMKLLSKQYKDKLDNTAKEYIHIAIDGVGRMSNLIQSLLKYSKAGRKEMEVQMADLNPLIEMKLLDLSQKIKERNVKVKVGEMPSIFCGKDQLAMVFYNLINNGIKFNKSDCPEIHVQSHQDAPDGFWKFSVSDNGIGIKKENVHKVFEIFQRLHAKSAYEGTGIGLSLCQKVVERHKGKIWVESEYGAGTTFYFTVRKNLHSENAAKEKIRMEMSN